MNHSSFQEAAASKIDFVADKREREREREREGERTTWQLLLLVF
jgi:hypothetical protein